MKISEMINSLQCKLEDFGDIDVVLVNEAEDFDIDQSTIVYGACMGGVASFKNKNYMIIDYDFCDEKYRFFMDRIEVHEVADKIKEFIGSTYFGTHDTMEFVCRYMDCDTERDREMVQGDMINFYTGKFKKEVDELLDLVHDAWIEGYSFEEIKEQLKD